MDTEGGGLGIVTDLFKITLLLELLLMLLFKLLDTLCSPEKRCSTLIKHSINFQIFFYDNISQK